MSTPQEEVAVESVPDKSDAVPAEAPAPAPVAAEPAAAPKRPGPKSAQEALAALDEPPAQAWGWGSLWNSVSAVASVTASLANTAVDKVYEALAEETENKPKVEGAEPKEKPTAEDKEGDVEESGILQTTENFFSTIDKTFDFASETLGNAVLTGYRALETADVGKKVESFVGSTYDSSKVVISGLVSEVEKFEAVKASEAVVGSGLNMLEALGERVAGVIVDATGRKVPQGKRGQSSGAAAGDDAEKEGDEPEPSDPALKEPATSFATAFPQTPGPKTLEKLQSMASEASIRAKRLPTAPPAAAVAAAKETEKIVDPDSMMEEAEEGEPTDESRKTLAEAAGRLEVNIEALVGTTSAEAYAGEEHSALLSKTFLALAELASAGIHVFHTLAVGSSWKSRKPVEVAKDVRSLAVGILLELQGLAGRHAEALAKLKDDDAEGQKVHNEIYREAGVAMGSIQDAAVAMGSVLGSWALEQN